MACSLTRARGLQCAGAVSRRVRVSYVWRGMSLRFCVGAHVGVRAASDCVSTHDWVRAASVLCGLCLACADSGGLAHAVTVTVSRGPGRSGGPGGVSEANSHAGHARQRHRNADEKSVRYILCTLYHICTQSRHHARVTIRGGFVWRLRFLRF